VAERENIFLCRLVDLAWLAEVIIIIIIIIIIGNLWQHVFDVINCLFSCENNFRTFKTFTLAICCKQQYSFFYNAQQVREHVVMPYAKVCFRGLAK
jgi:hypothetical protein